MALHGTYEGGSASSTIRLYSSVAERDADTPVEGLIGLVYDTPFIDATLGATTYGLYFKKRVVLTTTQTLTDFSFINSDILTGSVTIDSSSATFTIERITSGGVKTYIISYTSEDGLIYIRNSESRAIIGQSSNYSTTITNQDTFPEIVNFLGINTDSSKAASLPITFGVYKYENGGWSYLDIKDITPSASQIVATNDIYYYYGGNKAYGNNGFVTGTATILDTSDATATASDILSGKTAYVNGVKLTGTYTENNSNE